MCESKKIHSIEELIRETEKDYRSWGLGESPWFPWFRGEPNCDTPLVPKLYRKKYEGDYFENRLLQHFRTRAMEYGKTPHRDETDLWLFLARHVGLPTRLLDWTEGSLVALYFALQEKEPIVWMLNPFALNKVAVGDDSDMLEYNIYPLTWYDPKKYDPKAKANIGVENIKGAWESDTRGVEFPVAVDPTNVHPRIPAQRSRFTVHGKRKESLVGLVSGKDIVKKYVVDGRKRREMLDELRVLGVSRATLFPELDGLAKDLTELFRPDLAKVEKLRDRRAQEHKCSPD
jgi:hypothetical protein